MSDDDVTKLLADLQRGDDHALDRLFSLVYDELRAIAHNQLHRERPGHTLNTTAVVHEAYLKLADRPPHVDWSGRRHFFALAGRAMRQILVNYAMARKAQKRGGARVHIPFDEERIKPSLESDELMALDEALERLSAFDKRQVDVVECRYFAGLTIDETAEILGTSAATVSRDWAAARLWLNREMRRILDLPAASDD